MKKNGKTLSRFALSALLLSTMTLGCNKQETNSDKKETKIEKKASNLSIEENDAVYKSFRQTFPGRSTIPEKAVFGKDKEVIVIGFGTPISEDNFVYLDSCIDGIGFKDEKVKQFKHRLYQSVLKKGEHIEFEGNKFTGNMLLRLRDTSIRKYTKNFIKMTEHNTLIPLSKKYGIDYSNLNPKIKSVMLSIELATGGKLSTYKNFLKAISEKNEQQAIIHSYVSAKQFYKTYPTYFSGYSMQLNRNMVQNLKDAFKENKHASLLMLHKAGKIR